MKKRAIILTWEKFQDVELIYAYYRLKEDFEVDIAANKIGLIFGINGTKIKSNLDIQDLKFSKDQAADTVSKYDLVLVVGGVISVEYARQNENFINILKEFNRQDKIIASICHGAQYLIEAELTKGKKIAGYYSIKRDIENSGAEYIRDTVVDGNIITAPHYDFQSDWMRKVVDAVLKK